MKKRLDVILVEKGLVPSREKARTVIMEGSVYVDNQKEDKAGTLVSEDSSVEVRGDSLRYVSRGGLKLERAMELWGIDLAGRVCMDIGASTGGFTDCMLQNGAKKVYCVDVGYGQLAWSLRNDPRVVNMERTNIRGVTPEQIGEPLDFCSVDVSFISLRLVLPVALALLRRGGEAAVLIKPQFEAGRGKVGKNGVVRDRQVHIEVINTVAGFTAEIGFKIKGMTYSPVKGPKGNIEYLMHIEKSDEKGIDVDAVRVVDESYAVLNGSGE